MRCAIILSEDSETGSPWRAKTSSYTDSRLTPSAWRLPPTCSRRWPRQSAVKRGGSARAASSWPPLTRPDHRPSAYLRVRSWPCAASRPPCSANGGSVPEEVVTFVQTSADANTYRDAVQFRNGQCVSLQHLTEGVPVRVLSLGGGVQNELLPAMAAPGAPFAAA